jgi:hypothetical protein
MTLLERAKRFLAQKASRLAVVVVPLAAVALSSSPAKAGSITLTSGSGCVLDVCTVSTGTGGGYSGMNSIDLSTSGSVTAFHIGDYQLDFSANGGVTGGSGSISPGTEIPVSWDFVLLNPQLDPTVTWNITFSLNDGSGRSETQYSYSASGSNATTLTGTTVSGTGDITIPASGGGDITGWSITLDTSATGSYRVDIPGDLTLVLNSPGSSGAVPEPSSMLLTVPGMGALLLLRRKKRS